MLSNILFLAAAGYVAAQDVTEIVASATSLGGDAATSAVGSALSGDNSAVSAASSFAVNNGTAALVALLLELALCPCPLTAPAVVSLPALLLATLPPVPHTPAS